MKKKEKLKYFDCCCDTNFFFTNNSLFKVKIWIIFLS